MAFNCCTSKLKDFNELQNLKASGRWYYCIDFAFTFQILAGQVSFYVLWKLSLTTVTITISFSVFQLAFRNMDHHIPEIRISLHVFIVSIFGFCIVVKCFLILPEGVGLAQLSLFLVVFQYWSSYSLGVRLIPLNKIFPVL